MGIEILGGQSSCLFSNVPIQKRPVMTIEDFDSHFEDHFESHLFGERADDDCVSYFQNSLVPLARIEGIYSLDWRSRFYVHIFCFYFSKGKKC